MYRFINDQTLNTALELQGDVIYHCLLGAALSI